MADDAAIHYHSPWIRHRKLANDRAGGPRAGAVAMRRQATPVYVARAGDAVSILERIDLRDATQYDEARLQNLIHNQPSVLSGTYPGRRLLGI